MAKWKFSLICDATAKPLWVPQQSCDLYVTFQSISQSFGRELEVSLLQGVPYFSFEFLRCGTCGNCQAVQRTKTQLLSWRRLCDLHSVRAKTKQHLFLFLRNFLWPQVRGSQECFRYVATKWSIITLFMSSLLLWKHPKGNHPMMDEVYSWGCHSCAFRAHKCQPPKKTVSTCKQKA